MSELHDDAAAYALDALDPAEQAAFEQHLAGCADCTAEVADLRGTAALLVLSTDVPPLPPTLRASVLAGIAGVEQLPALPGRPRRALGPVEPVERDRPGPAVAAPSPLVDELAVRRASRRARVLSVLVAAVSVVALALGGVVYSLARQQQPVVAGPAPTTSVPQVDPSLLAAPDAKIVKARVSGVDTAFVVSKSEDRAAFVSTDLPDPGQGNVYHLWTLRGGTVVRPDTTFPVQDQGHPAVHRADRRLDGLAINVEPAGTTPDAPTSAPLAIVKI